MSRSVVLLWLLMGCTRSVCGGGACIEPEADFAGVGFAGVDFAGADLAGADFAGVDLAGVDLAGVDLAGVDLAGADFAGVDFAGVDLAGSDSSVGPTLEPAQNGLFGGMVQAIDHDSGGTLYVATRGGGVFKSNSGSSWTAINNGITGLDMRHLAADRTTSGVVYADSVDLNLDTTLFRTTDGTNWTALDLPVTSIDAIAVDPGSGKPLFTVGSDVYRADDGIHFAIINPNSKLPGDPSIQLLFTQAGHVLAVTSKGVSRSEDGGVTWAAVNGGLPTSRDLRPASVDPTTGAVYLSSSVQIFKSANDGKSWAPLDAKGLPSQGTWGMAAGGGFLYAFGAGVQRSSDDGASFSDFSTGLTELQVNNVHVLGSSVFAGTAHCGVFASAGSGWSPASSGLRGVGVTSLAQSPSSSTLYAGSAGMGVFKSTNGGQSWTAHDSGLPRESITAVAVDPLVPSRVYAGSSQHKGVFRSDDGGLSWSAASVGLSPGYEVHMFLFDPRAPSAVWAVTTKAIYFSANRGDSWTSRSTGLTFGACCNELEMRSLVMDPKDSMTLWASSMATGVWKTVDGGGKWTRTALTLGTGGLAIDPKRLPRRLYAATEDTLMRSDDGGASFVSRQAITADGFDLPEVAVDPSNPSRVFIADAAGVHFSSDAGANFTRIDGSLFPLFGRAVIVEPTGRAWVGTRSGGGLFRTP